MIPLLALFLAGCEPQGQKALLEGERLLQQDRFNEAIRMLEISTAKLPREARAWNLLGLAYHGAGLGSQAAQAYEKALALDHKLSAARFNLGSLLLEQDQASLAVGQLTAFTLLQPKAVNGWLRLAAAQMRLNRLDAADTSYRTALSLVPKQPEALNGLGVIQIQRKRYIDAIQFFQAALAESPNYPQALLNQAIVTHRYLGQRTTALQKYRQYLALQPRPENWDSVSLVAQALADEISGVSRSVAPGSGPGATNPGVRTPVVAGAGTLGTLVTNQRPAASNPASSASPTSSLAQAAPPRSANLAGSTTSRETKVASPQPVPTLPVSIAPPPASTSPVAPATGTPVAGTGPSSAGVATPAPVVTPPPTLINPVSPNKSVGTRPVEEVPPAVVVADVAPPITIKPPQELVNPNAPAGAASRPAAVTTPARNAGPAVDGNAISQSQAQSQAQEKRGFFQRLNPFRKSSKPEPPPPPSVVTATPPARSAGSLPSLREEALARANVVTTADSLPSRDFKRYSYRRPGVAAGGDRQKASELVNKGILAHRDRRPEEELAFYRSAVLSDPANYDAYFNLGMASAEQGDLNTSLDAYEHALAIAPDSASCRYNFALALRQSDYPIDAARELETILQTNPGDGKVLLALGNLYAQKLKQPQIARGYYLRMLEADPSHPRAADVRFWLANNP